MKEKEGQVQRPKIGDKVIWHADGWGGEAEVVDVYYDPVNSVPGALPRIRALGEGMSQPSTFLPYEYELEGDDKETLYAEETRKHIAQVNRRLCDFANALHERGRVHDASKLRDPEMPIFAEHSAKFKELEYGTPEYMAAIKGLGPALTHHYEHNDHHPEHHEDGVNDMDLLQIVEMYCDWCAAVKRIEGGSIDKSIDVSEKRFALSPQLAQIFRNTAARGMK